MSRYDNFKHSTSPYQPLYLLGGFCADFSYRCGNYTACLSLLSFLNLFNVNVGFLSFLVMDYPWAIAMLGFNLLIFLVQARLIYSSCKMKTIPINQHTPGTTNDNPSFNSHSYTIPSTVRFIPYEPTSAEAEVLAAKECGLNYILEEKKVTSKVFEATLGINFMSKLMDELGQLFKEDLFAPYYVESKGPSREEDFISIPLTHASILSEVDDFKVMYANLPSEKRILESRLCHYVKKGDIGMVYFLLQLGCPVDTLEKLKTNHQCSLLGLAAKRGDKKMIKLLVNKGANIKSYCYRVDPFTFCYSGA